LVVCSTTLQEQATVPQLQQQLHSSDNNNAPMNALNVSESDKSGRRRQQQIELLVQLPFKPTSWIACRVLTNVENTC
jgi:hypothetical protein